MKKIIAIAVCLTLLLSFSLSEDLSAEEFVDPSLSIAASCEGLLISYSRKPFIRHDSSRIP